MNRKTKLSSAIRLFLASAAFTAALGLALPRIFPAPRGSTAGIEALQRERDRLAEHTNGAVESLRRQVAARFGATWTDSRSADLRHLLCDDWAWKPIIDRSEGKSSILVTARAPASLAWPSVVTALENIERYPGVAIERIDFAAVGMPSARRLDRAAITVRILRPRGRTRPDPERAAPLVARSRPRGGRPRPGRERSRVSSCAPPAVRGLPDGLRFGVSARPF